MTKLYRAVSIAEWSDIRTCGEFRAAPPSNQGKWFAESLDGAIQWGSCLYRTHESFLVVTIDVATGVADQLFGLAMLDGIGPARYTEIDQLPLVAGLPILLA